MYTEAVEEQVKAIELFGSPAGAQAVREALASGGWKGATRKAVELNKERAKYGYVSPFLFAILYMQLGEKDEAIRWLENAYQERHYQVVLLKVLQVFDPLRDDPRFQDLVRRVGLAP